MRVGSEVSLVSISHLFPPLPPLFSPIPLPSLSHLEQSLAPTRHDAARHCICTCDLAHARSRASRTRLESPIPGESFGTCPPVPLPSPSHLPRGLARTRHDAARHCTCTCDLAHARSRASRTRLGTLAPGQSVRTPITPPYLSPDTSISPSPFDSRLGGCSAATAHMA